MTHRDRLFSFNPEKVWVWLTYINNGLIKTAT